MSSSVGPEYYVNIMSFVDKSQARLPAQLRESDPLPSPRQRSPTFQRPDAPLALTAQLEPGCSILMHNKVLSVVGILQDEADPMVSVMKVCLSAAPFPPPLSTPSSPLQPLQTHP